MQANDVLKYRDKTIEAFRDGTFASEHSKKFDDASHDYMLEDVNSFIQKIESMGGKINLSFLDEFFESSYQLAMQICLSVLRKNENKEIVADIENRISGLKDKIREMSEKKQNCG